MKPYDANLMKYLNKSMRKIKVKLVFGDQGNDRIETVQTLDVETNFGNTIAIGNTVSTSVKVTCETPSFSISGREFTLFFGAKISEASDVMWTKMGIFYVLPENIENRLGFTTFTAYDRMYTKTRDVYTCSVSEFPSTAQTVLNDICASAGLTAPELTVNPAIEADYLTEYTLRDAIGYIASYLGMNAYIDCDGNLSFKWFNTCAYVIDGYNANVPYADERDTLISKLICSTGDDNILVGEGSDGLIFNNPLMTSERLAEMLPDFDGFQYRRLDAEIPVGNYLIESGDILQVVYQIQGTTHRYTVPAMSVSFHYDGGLSCRISSYKAPDSVMKTISARKFTDHTKYNKLQESIIDATNKITGATGGYVRINFGDDGKTAEIMILDKPEIDNPDPTKNAKYVWRWNQAGLGHSSNGYNGPFDDVAITAKGEINANYITAGELNGINFRTIHKDGENKSTLLLTDGSMFFYDDKTGGGHAVGGLTEINDDSGRSVLYLFCNQHEGLLIGHQAFNEQGESIGYKATFEYRPTRSHPYFFTEAAEFNRDVQFDEKAWVKDNNAETWGGGNWNVGGALRNHDDRITNLENALNGLFTIIED